MEFSRQQYRSWLPSPPPGDLPNPGMEPESLASSFIDKQILYQLCNLGSSVPQTIYYIPQETFLLPMFALLYLPRVCACVWCVLELCLSVCASLELGAGSLLHQGCNLAPHMVSELMGNLNLKIPCVSGPLRNEAVDPTLPKLGQSCILFGVNLRH